MHPRDDDGQRRRQYRRLEDSRNANWSHRLDVLERVTLKHEAWLEDLGVGDMSKQQRAALPDTLDRTLRWSRRDRRFMTALVMVTPFLAVFLDRLLEHVKF